MFYPITRKRTFEPVVLGVTFGSEVAVQNDFNRMAALGWKADIQTGRMSALTNTGRSEALELAKLNVSYRPEAAECN